MPDTEYLFANYRLVSAARELWRDDRLSPTPRLVFDCLLHLIRHRSRAVGRDELVAAIWGRIDVTDGQVNQLMLRVRRVFGDDARLQNAIRTVPGFGYRWVVDVVERPLRQPTRDVQASPAAAVEETPPSSLPAAAHQMAQTMYAEPEQRVLADPADPSLAPRVPSPVNRPSGYRLALLAITAIAALVALAYHILDRPTRLDARASQEQATVVLPLEISAPADAGWVRLGAMDLIAERLRNAGLLVPPSENVLIASRDASAAPPAEHRARLRRTLGAGLFVDGRATRSASGWKVELDATSDGAVTHHVEAEQADVIEAARQAADLLLAALGHVPPDARETSALHERMQQIDAALLANEVDTALAMIDALAESDRNDPQVRFRSAQIDIRSGRFEAAEATLTGMLDDPAVRSDPLLIARALSARGTARGRHSEFAAAEQDFDAAVRGLAGHGHADDLGRALNGRGTSRVGLHRFDEAALDFGQARIEYTKAADRLGLAQTDTNLGLLEAERNRLEQALPYLAGAARQFEAFGAVERQSSVLIALFDAQCLLLRWPEALRTSETQWALRQSAHDPGLGVQIAVNRGMALLALGRDREANALLAGSQQQYHDERSHSIRYLHAFEARVAWRAGRNEKAASAAAAALATWPGDTDDSERAGIELLRQRALLATGAMPSDAAAPTSRNAAQGAAADIAVASVVASAEWAAHRQHDDEAEREFRRARELAEATGVPADIALVARAYAPWLLARHRLDEASAVAGRVAPWANRDFDCALLLLEVLHAQGQRNAWVAALRQAQALAGERAIPSELAAPPAS